MRICTEDDIFEYIFELSCLSSDNTLGMVCREQELLELEGITIAQSKSLLSQHSTGAMVWNTTPKFAHWIRTTSPLRSLVESQTIVELGSGSGALAMLLQDFTHAFIATDQRPLLKLLRQNCGSEIIVREFDWELHEFPEQIKEPVTVVACDTIYNEYLIAPFVDAIFSTWKACKASEHAIIAAQVREPSIIEKALSYLLIYFAEVDVYEITPGYVAILVDRAKLEN